MHSLTWEPEIAGRLYLAKEWFVCFHVVVHLLLQEKEIIWVDEIILGLGSKYILDIMQSNIILYEPES